MYMQAMGSLEDERGSGAPSESLGPLTDEVPERPPDGARPAHEGPARDLIAQMAAWQQSPLQMARELAVGATG